MTLSLFGDYFTPWAEQMFIVGIGAMTAIGFGGIALGIMALMFWPQSAVALEDLNRLVLWPATFVQFWAGRRYYVAAWRALRSAPSRVRLFTSH